MELTEDPVKLYIALTEAGLASPASPGKGARGKAGKEAKAGAVDLTALKSLWMKQQAAGLSGFLVPVTPAEPALTARPPNTPPPSTPHRARRLSTPATAQSRRLSTPATVQSSGYGPINLRRRSTAADAAVTPKKKKKLIISPLQPPLEPLRPGAEKPLTAFQAWRLLQMQEREKLAQEELERQARKSSGYGRASRSPPPPEEEGEETSPEDEADEDGERPEKPAHRPRPPHRPRSSVASPRAIAEFAASLDHERRHLIGGHHPEHPIKYCTCCRLATAPPVLPLTSRKGGSAISKIDPKRALRLASALIVQVCLQSWAARRQLEQMRLLRRRETACAMIIRRWWRFHFISSTFFRYQRIFRVQRAAAVRIQRAWRRFRRKNFSYLANARKAAVRIVRWFRRLQLVRKRFRAALRIQRFRRRYAILKRWQRAAYRMLFRAQQSALRIQAAFKMHRCRRPLLVTLAAKHAFLRQLAATRIQMAYRRHRVGRRIAQRRYRAARSAWRWRGAVRVNRFRGAVYAAMDGAAVAAQVIQAIVRRRLAWRALQRRAVERIEAAFRMKRAARLLNSTRWAVHRIQRYWRRVLSRDALARAREQMRAWMDSVAPDLMAEAPVALDRVAEQIPAFFTTQPNSPLRVIDRWRVLQVLVAHKRFIRAVYFAAAMDGVNTGAAGVRAFALSTRKFHKLVIETLGIPLPRPTIASLFIVVNRDPASAAPTASPSIPSITGPAPPSISLAPATTASVPDEEPRSALAPIYNSAPSERPTSARRPSTGAQHSSRPQSANHLAPGGANKADRPTSAGRLPANVAATPAASDGGTDGDQGRMSLDEFAEALLRVSLMLYPPPMAGVAPGTSEAGARVKKLLADYVKPAAEKALHFMPLALDLRDSSIFVTNILKRFDKELGAVFRQWAKSTEDKHDAGAQKLNWREFLTLLQTKSMIGPSLSTAQAFRSFVFSNGQEINVFLESPDGSRLDSLLQMDFEEFLEALCRCCARASSTNVSTLETALAVPVRELEPFLRRLIS